ncbi:hypothetical protein F0562_012516 [Nyssa sinensis]|uniref:Protein kinase domain-containing protein n=1 Tax=Nyssa sinensis TaxID=561372 RepID=A0A5J4ZWS6_9ASTE|nr:hypothetical protein F0562_012516 [Nyssa sinensis]
MWKLTSFQRLDFTEVDILSSLTENNLIGSGGSGKVYRIAVNHSGEYVVVKRICRNRKLDHKLEKEFLAEIQILGTVRHSNIVKLLCCISNENSKLLVYEYMENQSLERWPHSSVHNVMLDWPTSTLPSRRPSMKKVLRILCRYSPVEGYREKKVGSEYDVDPLFVSGKHLSSYKVSKKLSEEDDDSLLFSV